MKRSNYKKSAQKVIDKVIDEVGYICCEHCGRSSGVMIHCHHIFYRSEFPRHAELHNPLNLLLLCHDDHSLFHSDKSIREPYIKERSLNQLFT